MADKKDNKEKYLSLLDAAWDAASTKSGAAISKDEIEQLQGQLIDTDPDKVPQFLALYKDKLAQVPEIASLPEFISITENPKVVEKDYGFTEGEDFYKMEGPKSWMNKSPVQLEANAKKYGMELGEYLNLVAKLATEKEKERQWKDNASTVTVKDVPYVGDVSVPGLTNIMLPTSFNKAAMGKDVTKGDIAYDIGTDVVEGGLATAPYGGPIWAALGGNAARQGKQIYDETQDSFHPLEFAGAGAMGAFGTPTVFKTIGDALKRVPGTEGMKPWRRFTKGIEDIGEQDPNIVLARKKKELEKQTALYRAVTANEAKKAANAEADLAKFTGVNAGDYVPYNPTPVEANLYGTGSKLWRNVKNGEILTEQEYNNAMNFLKEANRGPDYVPTPKNVLANQYRRAEQIKNMPYGDILVNAWSEPKLSRMLREGGRVAGGQVGGRAGVSTSDNDKKLIANKIINSADWGRYITGLPHNLTDEEIYIATMYGDK